jgi:hypothetical protein
MVVALFIWPYEVLVHASIVGMLQYDLFMGFKNRMEMVQMNGIPPIQLNLFKHIPSTLSHLPDSLIVTYAYVFSGLGKTDYYVKAHGQNKGP